ncbi:MAG: hypothetical protein ACM3ZR_08365 [Pseudomonadota bacterium]
MLVVLLSTVALVTILGFLSTDDGQEVFDRYCADECISARHKA